MRLLPLGIGLIPLPRKRKDEMASMYADTIPQPQSRVDPKSDPLILNEAKASPKWPQWQTALCAEYASLQKHNVFGELIHSLKVRPIGHKLIFTKKQDAQGNLLQFKVRLMAQGFRQCLGIDYDSTYNPVIDVGSFRYLLGIAVQLLLQIQLLNVVTTYLHGPLEMELFIKPSPLFSDDPTLPQLGRYLGLRIQKALYGLKQVGRLWYQHLCDLLIDHQFSNDPTLSCIFVYKRNSDFVILAVYVDDINLVGTLDACHYALTTSSRNLTLSC